MNKYSINDIERGVDFLKKKCQATYVILEIDELGRLKLKGSDISGNIVTITIYHEETQKMPDVTKTERL